MNNFLDFVEIRTKLASVMPFFVGLFYSFYCFGKINVIFTLMFFTSMISFDLFTTGLNNTLGRRTKSATEKPHYSMTVSIAILTLLFLTATVFGIALSLKYGLVLLFTGMFCFAVGVTYSFGPFAIYRTQYGELISGALQGFFIPFLVMLVNAPDNSFVVLTFNGWFVNISINFLLMFKLIMVTIPLICLISNIMLANNTCDVLEDTIDGRFTLPYHIGKRNSVLLFKYIYVFAYAVIAVSSILHIIPYFCIFVLVGYTKAMKNVKVFEQKQIKRETFHVSIKNFVLISVPYALLILIGGIVKF